MANKLALLNTLAKNLPTLNEKARQQTEAARTLQLQNAVAQAAPTGTTTAQTAQAVAPQVVQQAGTEAAKSLAATQQGEAQLAGAKLEEARQTGQEEVFRMQQANEKSLADQRSQLTNLGTDIDNKLFQSRMKFEQDESGRKFSNERQLMDWTVMSAKSQEEFKDRMQTLELAQERNIELMKAAQQKVLDIIRRGWITKEARLDFEQTKNLKIAAKGLQEEIDSEVAKKQNRMMIAQGVGSLVGGVVGAVGGGATGAQVGSKVGGVVGLSNEV